MNASTHEKTSTGEVREAQQHAVNTHQVVSAEEWQTAHEAMLRKEKAFMNRVTR